MLVDPILYRKAFLAYLRKGTPIEWSIKQERPTTHYFWRTRGDEDVRPSHAANAGHIFAWDNPPPTGHPGEDYGCRCTAEPYYPEVTEHVTISVTGVSDTGSACSSRDFVRHYYQGRGRGVTVRETGHLRSVVEQYLNAARRSLQDNIARMARENSNGQFSDYFVNTYNMETVVFSIGRTTVGGRFVGNSSEVSGLLAISGEFEFYLRDEFVDPLDVGVEAIDIAETVFENVQRPLEDYLRERVGLPPSGPQRLGIHTGEPYAITDEWSGHFEGRVYRDPARSDFG